MAGSYGHVVNEDGNLKSNQYIADILENGGDVYETVEEMYGMIWYLAAVLLPVGSSITAKKAIEEAREYHEVGLRLAQMINLDLEQDGA
jgi:hypothetical protein